MLPKKCEKCRVNIIAKQCPQCFKDYCQLCGSFEQGICQMCMRLKSKIRPQPNRSGQPPKNVDDYFDY